MSVVHVIVIKVTRGTDKERISIPVAVAIRNDIVSTAF